MAGQADLFAKHGVWEFPFATGSLPKRLEGRENIRSFGQAAMERSKKAGRRIVAYNSISVHYTRDPNTIIVEFELEGKMMSQKTSYRIPYIQLLSVEHGEIVFLRDYFPMGILKRIDEFDN